MDLKELDLLGDRIGDHWYYRAKAQAVLQVLGPQHFREVLDVGAGSGFFSKYLLEHGRAASACCVDTSYSLDEDVQHAGKPMRFRRSISASNADLVLLMDVLEHVDDDVDLLRDYIGKVGQGARFLITVPAFQWLWSPHDDFLEHKRRYTVRQIEDTARRAGLEVLQGNYFFGAVFPLAAATRLAGKLTRPSADAPQSQLRQHSAAINNLLYALCRAELPLTRSNRLLGLTAICLAVKR